jgi:hypothetical protein
LRFLEEESIDNKLYKCPHRPLSQFVVSVSKTIMSLLMKRLHKEKDQLIQNPDEQIHLVSYSEDITKWTALITAPADSYYSGYEFTLDISVPPDYPLVPPIIYFRSKIFHPNVVYEVVYDYSFVFSITEEMIGSSRIIFLH